MSSANPEPWISHFLGHILSPPAVGDFVLTTLGAGVAFVGAVWLFRRQLRHDRELFREQIETDRAFRRSEMRRVAAHRLGQELVAASNEFNGLDNDELLALLVQRGFLANHSLTPGTKRAYEAYKAALYELDLDKVVLKIWSAKLQWWEGVQNLLADARLTKFSDEDRKTMLYYLVEKQFNPLDNALRKLGTDLIRWDGDGEIPTIAADAMPSQFGRGTNQMAMEKLGEVLREEAERAARRAK